MLVHSVRRAYEASLAILVAWGKWKLSTKEVGSMTYKVTGSDLTMITILLA